MDNQHGQCAPKPEPPPSTALPLPTPTSQLSHASTQVEESKKPIAEGTTVVKAHKNTVLLRYWVHLLAIGITALLASINILSLYFMDSGDQNANSKLNAFQFAAKVHEILLAASLTLIVMDCIRGRLISPEGVPLGFILSPVLFNDLDWLISSAFWSCLKPTWASFPFTVLLVAAIPFANLAGPLSAILIVPRLGWSNAHPAAQYPTFWNVSATELWPTDIGVNALAKDCGLYYAPSSCPQYARTSGQVVGLGRAACTLTGTEVSCNNTMSTTTGSTISRYLSFEFDTHSLSAYASSPTPKIFEVMADRFSDGVAFSLPEPVPGAETADAEKEQLIKVLLLGDNRPLKPVVKATCERLDYAEIYDFFTQHNRSAGWDEGVVTWLGDITDATTRSFMYSYLKNDTHLQNMAEDCKGEDCYAAIGCSIDVRWAPMDLWFNMLQPSLLYQSNPNPMKFFGSAEAAEASSVHMRHRWLELMDNESFGQPLVGIVGLLNDLDAPFSGRPRDTIQQGTATQTPNPTNQTQAMAIIVAAQIAESLATYSNSVGQTQYNGNCSDIYYASKGFKFAPGVCDQKPAHWITTKTLGDLQHQTTMVNFTIQRKVYGWFLNSTTVKIALAALLLHALLTFIYVIAVLIFRRKITTRWASGTDMLVLAINSLPAPALMGNSTGIDNHKLWRERVTVRETDGGDQVSLVVGDPNDYQGCVGDLPRLGKKYN